MEIRVNGDTVIKEPMMKNDRAEFDRHTVEAVVATLEQLDAALA